MNSDAQTFTVESTPDEENSKMEIIAHMAASLLAKHYKNHLWSIGWLPGYALCIKNMGIGGDGYKYGFTVDVAKAATVSEIEKSVIYGGGELLERCGAPRGAWDGQFMYLKDQTEDRLR